MYINIDSYKRAENMYGIQIVLWNQWLNFDGHLSTSLVIIIMYPENPTEIREIV